MARVFGKYTIYLLEEELELLNKNGAFASENPSLYILIKKGVVDRKSRQTSKKDK